MAKILVIDDENQLLNLLKTMLIRDGHQVFIAPDGVEGIQIFNEFHPDLIITDIIMPNKDGIDVIVDVLGRNPELPIIAISGGCRSMTSELNLDSAKMLGVKDILEKPFTHKQLSETIERALNL
jgi:DNA-binding NtrC family response regulator